MDVNPIEVQRCLRGISYPASKDELVAQAQANGASDDLVSALQSVDAERFEGPDDVQQALG